MTTKLEQAARQALGALVRAEAMYGQPNADIQTALREALAEQADMNLNCKSVQARLATSWGYVKAEQAEQEPVAWNDFEDHELAEKLGWRIGDPLYTTAVGLGKEAIHHFKVKNAAPVRTKDLTDDEIAELWRECEGMSVEDYARAVIAADREKNK